MSTKEKTKEETFEEQAKKYAACAIGNIREMVEAMEHAAECTGEVDCETCEGSGQVGPEPDDNGNPDANTEGTCPTCNGEGTVKCSEGKDSDCPEAWHDEDQARERIEEDALSVEVRSDWHTPGDTDIEPSEYNILITTGGPAARITGSLGAGNQPDSAVFEYQDWFKPWTEVYTDSADTEVMLKYAQCFYFGE